MKKVKAIMGFSCLFICLLVIVLVIIVIAKRRASQNYLCRYNLSSIERAIKLYHEIYDDDLRAKGYPPYATNVNDFMALSMEPFEFLCMGDKERKLKLIEILQQPVVSRQEKYVIKWAIMNDIGYSYSISFDEVANTYTVSCKIHKFSRTFPMPQSGEEESE